MLRRNRRSNRTEPPELPPEPPVAVEPEPVVRAILVGPAGYRRVIGHGSVWTRIGRVVEGEICGHLPTLEQPELVTAALRDWLGEVSPDVSRRGDDDEHA